MCRLLCLLLFLCVVPFVVPLLCYTCVFPTISPLDCIKFPLKCNAGQLCVSSRLVGNRGGVSVVLYEKSCVFSSLCNLTGEKFALGVNFTFTTDCCDTNLCNRVGAEEAHWTAAMLLLLSLSFSILCGV